MSAFRFRLTRLQHVRGLEEHVARELFLSADGTAQEAESAAAEAQLAFARAEDDLRAAQSSARVDVYAVFAHQRHVDVRRTARTAALAKARNLRSQANELRQRWSERRKELRGIERLEARDELAWRQEELVRDARALDEVAIARAQRNKAEHRPSRVDTAQPEAWE